MGRQPKDDPRTPCGLALPRSVWHDAKRRAEEQGITATEYVVRALHAYPGAITITLSQPEVQRLMALMAMGRRAEVSTEPGADPDRARELLTQLENRSPKK